MSTVKVTIDGRAVDVPAGATILDAAEKLGIRIPTMCFLSGRESTTSCMVCVVKVAGAKGLLPACGTPVYDGMEVTCECDQVRDARKAALELLLSDHVGDCMGPCQLACPARMNIPLMIRQIAAGEPSQAIATIKADIALPAVLGRICPAPCENACRRRRYDKPVSICLLKRYVADIDLAGTEPYLPQVAPPTGKRVAVVGAGPAGLAAAYYLLCGGFACTIFERHVEPGGMLRYGLSEEELGRGVLMADIERIFKLGVEFEGGRQVGKEVSLDELRRDFDAVFLGVGESGFDQAAALGLQTSESGVKIDPVTYRTSLEGVFAGGDAVRRMKRKLSIRALADGKEAAHCIVGYLTHHSMHRSVRHFNSRIGSLSEGEIETFVSLASDIGPVEPTGIGGGFADRQAIEESCRCLHCDCRKAAACRLRDYAALYDAKQARYKGPRRVFAQVRDQGDVVYEPGKCIDCGMCITVASEHGEDLGLTFVGRGFDVRVAVPFDGSLSQGLKLAAAACVQVCPTGALAFIDD